MPIDEQVLKQLFVLTKSMGEVKEGVSNVEDDVVEIKQKMERVVTHESCQATREAYSEITAQKVIEHLDNGFAKSIIARVLSDLKAQEIEAEDTSEFPVVVAVEKDGFWKRAQLRLSVVVSALGLLVIIGGGGLWIATKWVEDVIKKSQVATQKSNAAIQKSNNEVKTALNNHIKTVKNPVIKIPVPVTFDPPRKVADKRPAGIGQRRPAKRAASKLPTKNGGATKVDKPARR